MGGIYFSRLLMSNELETIGNWKTLAVSDCLVINVYSDALCVFR